MKVKGFVSLRNEKIRHFFRRFFGQSDEENFTTFGDMFIKLVEKMVKKAFFVCESIRQLFKLFFGKLKVISEYLVKFGHQKKRGEIKPMKV